ncbi:MAG TPA: acyl-CoA dehydrogenase, partial [Spirochaetota bacterium]|nr:acyl-CoA dehydrogenase [Spirochaetota bacterium]
RDAAVNELWEGPRNVLLTQIHRDLQRASSWYSPAEFSDGFLHGADEAVRKQFREEITELTAHPNLFGMDRKTIEVCRQWDSFCQRLFNTYQDLALHEVEQGVPAASKG